VNVEEIAETKKQLCECFDENQLVKLIRTYEQILNAPVHVEINVSVLDSENQPRRGGFRKKGWHHGKPLPVDTAAHHLEFPPIHPGATLVHGDYRDSLGEDLAQCFDTDRARALLKRIEDGHRPTELDLHAYSLFLVGSEEAHSASPMTLARVFLGQLNKRKISVTMAEGAGGFKKEAGVLVKQYGSVADLDRAILTGNVLFSALSESPEAVELLEDIQRDLELTPKQVRGISRISDLVREEESPKITVGQALRAFLSLFMPSLRVDVANAVREYIILKQMRHFNWPVQRYGTTIYAGPLREDLATKIRLRRPTPIAEIVLDLL